MDKKVKNAGSAASQNMHISGKVQFTKPKAAPPPPAPVEDKVEIVVEAEAEVEAEETSDFSSSESASSVYDESSTTSSGSSSTEKKEEEAVDVGADYLSEALEDVSFASYESENASTDDSQIGSRETSATSVEVKKKPRKIRSIDELLRRLNERRRREFDRMLKPPKETKKEEPHSPTISPSFFEDLFPLMLEEKLCQTESLFKCGYFEPKKTIDYVWMHSVLGEAGYKDFSPPIEFSWKPPEERVRPPQSIDVKCPFQTQKALTYEERLELPRLEEQRRIRLSFEFANRTQPWYIQDRLQTDKDFQVTESERNTFTDPFELEILHNIQTFDCRLLILDVAIKADVEDLKRWLKFCNFVQTIIMLRCPVVTRRVATLGDTFHAIHFEENTETPWQEVLEKSLAAALKYAKEKHLYTTCTQPFLFVFASKRGMSTYDSFRVLCKN